MATPAYQTFSRNQDGVIKIDSDTSAPVVLNSTLKPKETLHNVLDHGLDSSRRQILPLGEETHIALRGQESQVSEMSAQFKEEPLDDTGSTVQHPEITFQM